MPQRKCAAKRLKADKQRILHNKKIKAEFKKEVKILLSLIKNKKISEAKERSKKVFAKLDRAAAKGIIHKNTVARQKSSLSLKLNRST